MSKLYSLFSLGAVLLIISSFLVVVIKADPGKTSEPTGNSSMLDQDAKPIPRLTATPAMSSQTTIPEPVDWDYMPLIMAMNITPTVIPTVSPHTPTPRPTSTAPPPPESTG